MTSNPKRPGAWNKPKKGVYEAFMVLTMNEENGYLEHKSLSSFEARGDSLAEFFEKHSEALSDEFNQKRLKIFQAMGRVDEKITWRIVSGEEANNVPTMKEQENSYNRLIALELSRNV